MLQPGAVLVHNAGIWPSRREVTADGLERAFVVNHLAAAALQESLLAHEGCVSRILVISAGLAVKGRFDPARTPSGADFSAIRTYATTKLCFALWMRDVAARFPSVDVAVVHPGVVRTGLGARSGPLGWLLAMAKRRWESPEACSARLARIFARDRWSRPGEACWMMEENVEPWPAPLDDDRVREQVRQVTERLLVET